MILFITPTEIESKHIDLDDIGIQHVICGIGKESLTVEQKIRDFTAMIDIVIVFGCCGLVRRDLALGNLYIPRFWHYGRKHIELNLDVFKYNGDVELILRGVTVNESIHSTLAREQLQSEGFQIVDQESFYIVDLCQKYEIPCVVIRYGEDYCDRKMIPIPGINHFYHKWNHWSMQKRMSKILKSLSDNLYGWIEDEC